MPRITEIQIFGGDFADMPTLLAREPFFCTDTFQLFVGDGAANHEIAGGGGGLTDGTYGEIIVSTGGTVMNIATSVVDNTRLADMLGWTFKIRNGVGTSPPDDAARADFTTATPATGCWLVGFDAGDQIRIFDVDDFPLGGTGDYIPTATDVDNFDVAGSTVGVFTWIRTNEYVEMNGLVVAKADAAGTVQFNLSLDIASNFGDANDAGGGGWVLQNDDSSIAFVSADSINDEVTVQYEAPDTAVMAIRLHFRYKVI